MNYAKTNLLIGTFLLGCAHHTPPTDLASQAELIVKQAEQPEPMGAAPLDARMAREKLDKGKQEMKEKDYPEARRLFEQAIADAQVAQSKAMTEKTRKTAEEANKTVETLKEESNRKVK